MATASLRHRHHHRLLDGGGFLRVQSACVADQHHRVVGAAQVNLRLVCTLRLCQHLIQPFQGWLACSIFAAHGTAAGRWHRRRISAIFPFGQRSILLEHRRLQTRTEILSSHLSSATGIAVVADAFSFPGLISGSHEHCRHLFATELVRPFESNDPSPAIRRCRRPSHCAGDLPAGAGRVECGACLAGPAAERVNGLRYAASCLLSGDSCISGGLGPAPAPTR